MTANEAYRLGQEDMKRRLAKYFRGYYFTAVFFDRRVTAALHAAEVPVRIRWHKTRDLTPAGPSRG